MRQFRYRAQPMRVVFGAGSLGDLGAEIRGLGLQRVLIVSGASQAQLAMRASDDIGPLSAGVHAEAVHARARRSRGRRDRSRSIECRRRHRRDRRRVDGGPREGDRP